MYKYIYLQKKSIEVGSERLDELEEWLRHWDRASWTAIGMLGNLQLGKLMLFIRGYVFVSLFE